MSSISDIPYLFRWATPDMLEEVEPILTEIGKLFQIQDDYLDVFGDEKVTGKIGTDIQDNKCSWLAVMSVQLASSEQKRILSECYGSKDPRKITRVKEIFKELNLKEVYEAFEKKAYENLIQEIKETSSFPKEVLYNILDKLYGRKS